ncbi:MAG: SDR family NAD(P)-dependent oxidoreductase [Clostridium sp.]|uniref:SDR family NAD(P)-dependent oxidoreductase n=1 Tax=Clostridium sp. TaxID=1506 RepID=UPI003F3AEB77
MEKELYTLITGGTKGIGYELAKLFADDGKNLFLVSRNEEELEKVSKELRKKKVNILYKALNLAKENELEELLLELDKLEIENIVNNAGVGSFGYFEEVEEKKDVVLLDLNIKAPTIIMKRLLPKMKKRGAGGILNVASTAAFVGGPKMSAYYSSKAYILTLTEALFEECIESNIKVSCLCPGPVKTGFQKEAGIVKSEKAKKYLMEASYVAKVGYNSFKKGKVIIVPGFKNKIMVLGTKFLPRCIIRKIIFKTNS